ncbi:MAG TPA: PKD domain-containing protein, partial [Crocinitomicaceae bacterium]|nr:PKD domain-containing protein [Crocinitomicaceae bacterium]
LPNNVNVLNIRYKGENGVYSSTLSKLFVKLPNSTAINNKIISYQYWIDEDFADKKVVNLTTAVQQVNVLGDLDMSQITKGNHTLYVQFLDTLGVWSVVNHHDFEKESFPISDFDYALTANCDSTIVTFTDKSIDGDTYLWDFGDGNTSTDASPEYVYYNPGTYLVSQTVTDTLTLADSTTIQTVVITGRTYGSTTQVACNSYTSPSGKIYTTTGVHNDTITNHLGCDSIIAINLTINNSTTYTDVQTACGSYTWIDGETYTANNNTATHILTNAAGCDSLVTLNLTIKPNPSINVTQEEIVLTATQTGASYQWLDCDNGNAPIANENGNVFTATQNGNYAVEISMNGCIDTSICYPVTTVGIVEATFDHAIAVYPNPTNGQVTIDLGKIYDNVAVTVQSINGQVVKQVQYQNQKLLDLSLDVSNGIYVISLVSNDKTAVLRVEKH